jgi:Tol biopolymer transport system component
MQNGSAFLTLLALSLLFGASSRSARAACNLIPQSTKVFDGAVGRANRPFAAPGEPIDLRLRPCDTASAGFTANALDHLVTVVFTPAAGPRHAVVLTAAPTCAAVTPLLAACESQMGAGSAATCVPNTSSALQVIDDASGRRLRFNFPAASVCHGGSNNQKFCTSDAHCPSGTCELNASKSRTLSGPATIVVSSASGAALPCDLATTRCAARTAGHCSVTTAQACTPATQSTSCPSGETCILDLIACVDELFANDGTCTTRGMQGTFNHFTALPVPNDFSAACFTNPSVCDATANEIRVTTDREGNVLLPMNWQGILVPSSIPVPRLLRAAIAPLVPLQLPGASFMASLTPEGGPLAPIFVPQFDPGAPTGVLNLFGSADAPYTILRLTRRSQTFQECSGGFNDALPCNGPGDCPGRCIGGSTPNARCTLDTDCAGGGACGPPGVCGPTRCFGGSRHGLPCNIDASCPGGECGPALFNVATFGTAAGTGPVVIARSGPPGICEESVEMCASSCDPTTCSGMTPCPSGPCVQFAMTAEDPVNLQSLTTNTQSVFAFSVEESVDSVDRNGDGDTLDSVVTLRDRITGAAQALGAPAGCGMFTPATPVGRALVQLRQSGQKFPAIATEGDVVAFLESERASNSCDINGDVDQFDAIVRAFKLGPAELTTGATVADSALVINGQNIVVSNGIVYYRHSESGQAIASLERASVSTAGVEGNADSSGPADGSPSLSADGRFVVFSSTASSLVPGDSGGTRDVFLRDRCVANGGVVPGCTPSTELISVNTMGAPGNSTSGAGGISADGRFVVFGSLASDLVAGDANGLQDVFLRDRCKSNGVLVAGCTPSTELISLRTDGTQTTGGFPAPGNQDSTVSADGRFVVFNAAPLYVIPGNTSNITNIFVRDRCKSNGLALSGCTPRTIRASVGYNPMDPNPNGGCGGGAISADGRYVAYSCNANNLVPFDIPGSGTSDIFVRDLVANTNEQISLTPAGGSPNNESYNPSISGDGRYVVFQSTATNIAPGATNGFSHIFVRDRLTRRSESLSINSDGIEGNNHDFNPVISTDGRFVAWAAGASNYLPGDGNAAFDIALHDRVTVMTELVSVDSGGAVGTCNSSFFSLAPSISDDGRTVAFSSDCTHFIGGDTNGFWDVYVHGPNTADLLSDLTGDGDRADNVLEQLDTATATVRPLCPASQVSVVAGAAAFLRPESAGSTINPTCTGGALTGPDLNGDSDTLDEVVHLAKADGSVENLGIAASLVAMSGLCTGGSQAGLPCERDGDCQGGSCTVAWIAVAGSGNQLQVHRVSPPLTGWTMAGRSADSLQMSGNLAVFLTSELRENRSLNGDNDKLDQVLHIYNAATGQLTNVGDSAREMVIGSETPSCGQGPAIAFRTSEAEENRDLNGDGDKLDDVLQVYVPGVGLVKTAIQGMPNRPAQSVRACNLAACDPRFPYRVSGNQIKFLTFEGDEGLDLNGDGDQLDLILQIFEVCTRTTTVAGVVDEAAASVANPLPDTGIQANSGDSPGAVVTAGARCVDGASILPVPATCATNADCPAGALCTTTLVTAAPAIIPVHDTVLVPPAPVSVTIPASSVQVTKVLKVKVRNADILPKKERPGHMVRLAVTDGTCPAGTVQDLADFDPATPGAQDTVLLPGGATKAAKVTLALPAASFPGNLHNRKAPYRCHLDLEASAVVGGNEDPNPRNNTAQLALNVVTLNGPLSAATHESVIRNIAPVKMTIRANGNPVSRTLPVKLVNADGTDAAGHDIRLVASDGDCPAGTLAVQAPATQTVAGGKTISGKVTVTATAAGFRSRNLRSPARCTAVLQAITDVPGNVEPDASNNSVYLVLDVNDRSDPQQ